MPTSWDAVGLFICAAGDSVRTPISNPEWETGRQPEFSVANGNLATAGFNYCFYKCTIKVSLSNPLNMRSKM